MANNWRSNNALIRRAIFLIAFSGSLAAVIVGCHAASQTKRPSLSSSSVPKTSNNISYEGVSFTFDPLLASEVKAETAPQVTDGKPCDIWPEHPAFTLVGLRRAQIRVFPLKEFREAFAIASKKGNEGVIYPQNPPEWTTYFDEEVRVLKMLLQAKPEPREVGRFVARARGEKGCSAEMPFLPMWEACQAFVGRLRYVNFKNGQGVFFLTQWDRETAKVSNDAIEYAFQGITADNRYWIYAEFSVAAPFLPNGNEVEVMAWKEKNYLLSHKSKKYQAYLRPVLAKLEALPANKFQPSLDLLEQLIKSLEVH